jgi:hypothetical protein
VIWLSRVLGRRGRVENRALRRRRILRVFVALFAIAVALVTLEPVAADTPDLTVDVLPSPIVFDPWPSRATVTAVVIVRNPTSNTFGDVQLNWFTSDPVEIAPVGISSVEIPPSAPPLKLGALLPGSDVAVKLHVLPTGADIVSGTLNLEIDFSKSASGTTPGAWRVVTLAVPEMTRNEELVAQEVTAQIQAGSQPINAQQPSQAFVIVTNKSRTVVTVMRPMTTSPDYLHLKVSPDDQSTATVTLDPGSAVAFQFSASVDSDRAVDGKHLVLFTIPVIWQADRISRSGTVSASYEADVQLLGETQALGALGVPTFLLIPGFLFVSVLVFLLQYIPAGQDQKTAPPLPSPTAPIFWVAAVTLSILAASIYPLLSQWIYHEARDYLASYGMNDVIRVWFGAILLGLITYAMFFLVFVWGVPAYKAWRKQEEAKARIIRATDEELVVLKKLTRLSPGLSLTPYNDPRGNTWLLVPPVATGQSPDKPMGISPVRVTTRTEDLCGRLQKLLDEKQFQDCLSDRGRLYPYDAGSSVTGFLRGGCYGLSVARCLEDRRKWVPRGSRHPRGGSPRTCVRDGLRSTNPWMVE